MDSETTTEAPIAKIVSTKERERKVPLEFEVEYDGKVYTEVTVRRVSGKEIEDYMAYLGSSKDSEERIVPPMIDCPLAVYEAMDDDDRFAIDHAMRDFLPRRLRAAAGKRLGPSEWRTYVGIVANKFATPIPVVLDMDWLRILEFYCDALNLEMSSRQFQAKIAGTKMVFIKR